MLIIQWNARSLLANGYEFKGYVDKLGKKNGYNMHSGDMAQT